MNLFNYQIEDDEEPVIRKSRIPEPRNRYGFCVKFDQLTKSKPGRFLGETKGWPDNEKTFRTLYDILSEASLSKNPGASINSWFKKFRESLKTLN